MSKSFFCLATAILLMGVNGAGAAESGEKKRWSDQAELSYVDTSGNTRTSTFSLKNDLRYRISPRWSGLWKVAILYGESNQTKNAESYLTELRFDHQVDERLYAYGNAVWLKNRFAGVDPRYLIGAGAGYKFAAGPRHTLVGEAGLGYVMETYVNESRHDYLSGRLFGRYTYAFTPRNSFSQSLEYLYDFSRSRNYNLNSETALIAALTDILSLKGSYTVRYDNDPTPATLNKTDSILGLALVVNF